MHSLPARAHPSAWLLDLCTPGHPPPPPWALSVSRGPLRGLSQEVHGKVLPIVQRGNAVQTPNSRGRGLLEAQRVPQAGEVISLATEVSAVELGQFAIQYFRWNPALFIWRFLHALSFLSSEEAWSIPPSVAWNAPWWLQLSWNRAADCSAIYSKTLRAETQQPHTSNTGKGQAGAALKLGT